MNFNVRRYDDFKELTVYSHGTTIENGFMDQEECRQMAAKLISAAEDLLHGDISVADFISLGEW